MSEHEVEVLNTQVEVTLDEKLDAVLRRQYLTEEQYAQVVSAILGNITSLACPLPKNDVS
jgi:hypothetical protein